MAAPVVSIVMAAYDASATIGAAIESARAQTLTEFELIVVNDGSTDDTRDIVAAAAAADERIILVDQENAGANAARNRALSMARGRYITFLDTDDLKLPTYLEAVCGALDADPGAGLAYTDAWILDDRTRRIYRLGYLEAQGPYDPPPADPGAFLDAMIEVCFVPYCSTTVRRAVLDEVGTFDPAIAGTDDYELWLRILLAGHRAIRVPGRLAVSRRIAGQISGDLPVMRANLRATYLKVAGTEGAPERVRARALEKAAELERQPAEESQGPEGWRAAFGDAVYRARISVTWVRRWRWRPPAEIAAAFPDLGHRDRS